MQSSLHFRKSSISFSGTSLLYLIHYLHGENQRRSCICRLDAAHQRQPGTQDLLDLLPRACWCRREWTLGQAGRRDSNIWQQNVLHYKAFVGLMTSHMSIVMTINPFCTHSLLKLKDSGTYRGTRVGCQIFSVHVYYSLLWASLGLSDSTTVLNRLSRTLNTFVLVWGK